MMDRAGGEFSGVVKRAGCAVLRSGDVAECDSCTRGGFVALSKKGRGFESPRERGRGHPPVWGISPTRVHCGSLWSGLSAVPGGEYQPKDGQKHQENEQNNEKGCCRIHQVYSWRRSKSPECSARGMFRAKCAR